MILIDFNILSDGLLLIINFGIAIFLAILSYFGYNQYEIDIKVRGEHYKNFSILQKEYQSEIMEQNNIVERNDKIIWEKALSLIVLERIE